MHCPIIIIIIDIWTTVFNFCLDQFTCWSVCLLSFNISEPSIKITLKEKLHLHFQKEISVLARQQQESVVQVLVFGFCVNHLYTRLYTSCFAVIIIQCMSCFRSNLCEQIKSKYCTSLLYSVQNLIQMNRISEYTSNLKVKKKERCMPFQTCINFFYVNYKRYFRNVLTLFE